MGDHNIRDQAACFFPVTFWVLDIQEKSNFGEEKRMWLESSAFSNAHAKW